MRKIIKIIAFLLCFCCNSAAFAQTSTPNACATDAARRWATVLAYSSPTPTATPTPTLTPSPTPTPTPTVTPSPFWADGTYTVSLRSEATFADVARLRADAVFYTAVVVLLVLLLAIVYLRK